ncbi:RNA polymerase II, large subunit, CTD [Cordyceps fumosorosea ARSEF 2679]|uniref:RNA polymerase II, large subunit, CTD n=1 Tax=Cordyceps fumosorosea (strain ARSEF 2679) TaxID=1081104 RepID=A0A167SC08_CORFA|nr:RNA polymerase II, large subunit, CTD [Cordyceps fumosorosea ARSEF 2679]OAA59470.1 RNA polymerase II, large subunit, CTD [Cordyceps fumosorosea ARSEF 2679]
MSGKGFAANDRSGGLPGSDAKLQKPVKQSVFDKQKAEAEAKRQRDAAETKAVYEDFVKSFDRDDDNDNHDRDNYGSNHGPRRDGGFNSNRGGPPRHGFGGGGSRRHFGASSSSSGMKSGPGSLGPAPNAFGKKRSFQDFNKGSTAPRDRGGMGFEDYRSGPPSQQQASASLSKAFATSDDEDMGDAQDREEDKAVARPTLRLSNVPPGTSPATIKAMMPSNLVIDNVKLLPPAPGAATERKSLVVIVTMSPETPATDMDAAVSALQNRYMGYGYYLALHRHLSSAVASSAAALPNMGLSSGTSHPFGAKPVEQQSEAGGKNAQQQQSFHRGFAPPTSYGPNYVAINRANILHVPVKPPQDVRTIQLINMVIEGVLEHGPEFEALLMSRPEVQREERWAWLWDARSEGGVWLRWRLWEVVTGVQPRAQRGKYVPLFEGAHAWKSPEKPLPFEYTTRMDEFVSDSEYNSSDDEDVDDEANNNNNRDGEESGRSFLNPLEKAKLTHLLARLPTTLGRLRKGDIARITAFAITHASRGVDEVVDMLITNVETPLSLASANPDRERDREREKAASDDGPPDLSGASLIGLYVVSDVLSSSSTSGVRHAWRYRQLLEAALRARGTLAWLGGMAERQGWGRLRAEKWKRSVGLVLHLWEGWCVFPAASQALFAQSFENPPSMARGSKGAATEETQDGAGEVKDGRWKLVEAKSAEEADADVQGEPIKEDDVEGEPIEEDDVEGEPIEEDDVEGEPIGDDDVEGEPIEEDDVGSPMDEEDAAGEPMDEDEAAPGTGQAGSSGHGAAPQPVSSGSAAGQRRRRMRAADMFADSGEDSC